jgi:hypothetical protein
MILFIIKSIQLLDFSSKEKPKQSTSLEFSKFITKVPKNKTLSFQYYVYFNNSKSERHYTKKCVSLK